jgi:hypothetical protein
VTPDRPYNPALSLSTRELSDLSDPHDEENTMSNRWFSISAVCIFWLAATLAPQPASAEQQDHVAAVKQSLQKSAAALHQYQWVETTVVSIKGEEKSRKQESCYYGADGKIEKVPIGGEPQSEGKKKRGLRGKIVENKKEEISDSMKEAVALVKQYIPPDPARIQAAKDEGRLSVVPPDAHGGTKVVIKDYLKAGDSLTLAMNVATDQLSAVTVSTFTDKAKDAVGLNVAFGSFPDGTVYAEKIALEVKSEDLAVAIANSGYKKIAG